MLIHRSSPQSRVTGSSIVFPCAVSSHSHMTEDCLPFIMACHQSRDGKGFEQCKNVYTVVFSIWCVMLCINQLKMWSHNVHGLNSTLQRSLLWRDVLKSKQDVICLQETHLAHPDVPCLKHKAFLHAYDSTSALKKAILIKDTVSFKCFDTILDPKQSHFIQ